MKELHPCYDDSTVVKEILNLIERSSMKNPPLNLVNMRNNSSWVCNNLTFQLCLVLWCNQYMPQNPNKCECLVWCRLNKKVSERLNFVLANCYLSPAVSFSTLSLHSWFCKSFSYNLFLTILFHILSMKVNFCFQKSWHSFFDWFSLIDWFLESPKLFSLFKHFHFNLFGHYSRYNCFFMSSSH